MSSITQSGIETQSDPLVTVTISGGSSECPGMHAICVRHSHLPELYGEGETTQEAAEDLLRQLLFESAYVDNNRQREGPGAGYRGDPELPQRALAGSRGRFHGYDRRQRFANC